MSYELSGTLHKKFETDQKTDSFQARDFVVEMEDAGYTNYIKFQLTQDRCDLIDPISEGDRIKVHFDLRGREWQGKFFTNLNAWKIEVDGSSVEVEGDWPDANEPEPLEEETPPESHEEEYPF